MKNRLVIIFLLMMLFLSGCKSDGENTRVVLTTGFSKNEIFRIENKSCTLPEVMVFLANIQNRYESVFGEEIWSASTDGMTLEEDVKDTVLAQLAQMKTMDLLAERNGVSLSDEEKEKAGQAATEYFSSLNETEKELLGVTEKEIENLYLEYALAEKVYDYIIKDINPEISDDEARTITVQHILLKTYAVDGTGKKIEYSEEEKKEVYRKAEEILKLAREEDSDFEKLIMEYSEDERSVYSFGKGEMESSFEEASFNLETGQISDIVETSYGYHIIKCISTFNREETDANKVKIVEKRKEEVFGQEYEAFVTTLTRNINEELWESVSLIHDENVTTMDFFEIYNKYFEKDS
ncbi:MAG: peptidylprolyl isomerase [Lachnospiraceae bacterium]|nr:peptidylprolyl isomerase [Lachnospiraceae bacterium]MDY4118332.1 peptidylprolyl isomerase [Lachnospiraceae bacterium]